MKRTHILTAALAAALSAGAAQAAELPQSAVLQYSGSYGIPATMTFTRSSNSYKIVSDIKVPLYKIRFESAGSIAGNTLKPSYYRDIRNGKVYAEAKFSGGKVSYGKVGDTKTENISGTALDLFALSWQLAANDGKLPAGLKITNGKNLYPVSGLNKTGTGTYSLAGGKTPIANYRVRRGGDTVNYSFATELGNIPAQIIYTDDGKSYNLKLKSLT
ncbi:MAG: DUF3108 domain-containing protein, partial [Neisseria sp.]|nr:DUF3108 domain-containing protein [Neisseria sp.]